MPCSKCSKNPKLHSFHHIGTTKQGYEIIYTCPGKTEGFDGNDSEFVRYFDEHLRVIEGKPWVWVFDSSDYKISHMLSIENLRNLVNYLYGKHAKLLQSTYVLHAGWAFQSMFSLVLPLLKKNAQKQIHVLSARPLETLKRLEDDGFSPNQIGQFLKSSS
jgi:hypothetical protein